MAGSITDPLTYAWRHARNVCFKPFDIGKWFVLGFCAWLAHLGQGGFYPNFSGNWHGWNGGGISSHHSFGYDSSPPINPLVRNAEQWARGHMAAVIILGAIFLLAAITVGLVLMWLRSRGKFMFLDGVVKNRAAVAEPWRQFARLGNSLFWFNLVFSLLSLAAFLAIAALGAAIAWPDIRDHVFGAPAVLGLVVGILLGCPVFLAVLIVALLLEDFVVPIMYATGSTTLPAWGVLRRQVLPGHVGQVVLFYLLRLAVGLAIGVALLLVCCGTCCIAGCLFLIPYLGTVALLPVLVFNRSWSVFMLGEMGDAWRIIPLPPDPNYPAPGYPPASGNYPGSQPGAEFGPPPYRVSEPPTPNQPQDPGAADPGFSTPPSPDPRILPPPPDFPAPPPPNVPPPGGTPL